MKVKERRKAFRILVFFALVSSITTLHLKYYQYSFFPDNISSINYTITFAFLLMLLVICLNKRDVNEYLPKAMSSNIFILLYIFWLVLGQLLGLICDVGIRLNSLLIACAYAISGFTCYYLIPLYLIKRNEVEYFMKLVAFLGVIIALFGVYGSFTGKEEIFGIFIRVKGILPFINAREVGSILGKINMYAFSVMVGLWCLIYFYRCTDIPNSFRNRKLLPLLIVFMVIAVFISWSRAIYLAFILGAVFLLIRRRSAIFIFFAIISCILITVTLYDLIITNFYLNSIFQISLGGSGRSYLWKSGIEAITKHPFFGVGFSDSMLEKTVYKFGGYLWWDKPMGAHNGFIDLGVQGGVLLAVLYVLGIVKSVYNNYSFKSVSTQTHLSYEYAGLIFVIFITAVIATTFLSYSIGGISYGSMILTIFLGIYNLSEIKIER